MNTNDHPNLVVDKRSNVINQREGRNNVMMDNERTVNVGTEFMKALNKVANGPVSLNLKGTTVVVPAIDDAFGGLSTKRISAKETRQRRDLVILTAAQRVDVMTWVENSEHELRASSVTATAPHKGQGAGTKTQKSGPGSTDRPATEITLSKGLGAEGRLLELPRGKRSFNTFNGGGGSGASGDAVNSGLLPGETNGVTKDVKGSGRLNSFTSHSEGFKLSAKRFGRGGDDTFVPIDGETSKSVVSFSEADGHEEVKHRTDTEETIVDVRRESNGGDTTLNVEAPHSHAKSGPETAQGAPLRKTVQGQNRLRHEPVHNQVSFHARVEFEHVFHEDGGKTNDFT